MSIAITVFGQTHTQSISFSDHMGPGNSGAYRPGDNFSVDLFLTFSGYRSTGLSLWFETPADDASHFLLTGFTYGTTFPDPNQPFTNPIGFTQLQSNGYYTTPNPSDFGATQNPPYDKTAVPSGTYYIGTLSFSLTDLTPGGIYVLRTDATGAHASEVTSYDGSHYIDEFIPNSEYIISVIPEPASLLLLAFGGLVAFVVSYRKVRFIRTKVAKQISVFITACVMFAATTIFAQAQTQSLILDDLGLGGGTPTSGTYFPNDSFGFDIYLSYSGYNAFGFSIMLEAQQMNNFAGSLFMTGLTHGTTFPVPLHLVVDPVGFTSSNAASPGYRTAPRDLGALSGPAPAPPVPPGTYFVAHVSFSLAGAMPGTYILESTPLYSEVSERIGQVGYAEHVIPASQYTVTVVPEPTTLSLVALGILGIAAISRLPLRTRGG